MAMRSSWRHNSRSGATTAQRGDVDKVEKVAITGTGAKSRKQKGRIQGHCPVEVSFVVLDPDPGLYFDLIMITLHFLSSRILVGLGSMFSSVMDAAAARRSATRLKPARHSSGQCGALHDCTALERNVPQKQPRHTAIITAASPLKPQSKQMPPPWSQRSTFTPQSLQHTLQQIQPATCVTLRQ